MLTLLLAAMLATACGGTGGGPSSAGTPTSPTTPVTSTGTASSSATPDHRVELVREGGRCPGDDGAGDICETRVTITQDRWSSTGLPTPSPGAGVIEPRVLEELVTLLDGGFDELTAEPFTGTCPTASDGQEVTIELWELPNDPLADASVRTSTSCTHDWRAPGARRVVDELDDLLDRAGIPF